MRTSKPISTISYNTSGFLVMKLNELVQSHKISDYMFIEHLPEEDELKQHIHLWINPNTLIDTMDLQDYLSEFDKNYPDKPLKCIDFRQSSTDDWILYSEHYPPYLAFKGESREYIYSKDDFKFYDSDTFNHNYLHAFKGSDFALQQSRLLTISELAKDELSPYEAFLLGHIPLHMASSINCVMSMQDRFELKTNRNGRNGHD